MPEAEDDLSLLIEAARTAGRIAMGHFRQRPEIWQKADDSPVTEADIAVDRVLRSDLLAARPDYGWLSEETEDDAERLGRARVFVVDPIDGTRAFIDGHETWAHALAVVENGEAVAGVVYLPASGKLYAAAKGQGATLNGARIGVRRAPDDPADATLLATRASLGAELWPDGAPQIRRAYRPSLAYRLALVAEGRFDGMLTLRDTWEWDIAAGAVIAAEAGAGVGDGRGRVLRFNKAPPILDGVMVAAPALHADLVARRGI